MDFPISQIPFSEREQKYYSNEFDRLTTEQKAPLYERELIGQSAASFFRLLKMDDSDVSKIWELVSEKRASIKLPNFMAAMRLCSAKKQGLAIIKENYMREQNILARRKRDSIQNVQKMPEKQDSEDSKSPMSSESDHKVRSVENSQNELKINDFRAKNEGEKVEKLSNKEVINKIEDKNAKDHNSDSRCIQYTPINEIYAPKNENSPKNIIKTEEIPLQISLEFPSPNGKNSQPSSYKSGSTQRQSTNAPNISKIPMKIPAMPKLYVAPLSRIEEEGSGTSSSSREPDITVDNPTLVSNGWFGASSYYLYSVTTRSNGKIYIVKRRFSDLD